jgi:hypothetical protein
MVGQLKIRVKLTDATASVSQHNYFSYKNLSALVGGFFMFKT